MRGVLIIGCLSLTFLANVQQPTEDEALARRAVEAERRRDFAGAVSAFEQLLKNGADSPELRNNLGIAYFQLAQYKKALSQFDHVLKSVPSSIPANLFAGLSLLKLQQPSRAIPLLRKAQASQPGDADVMLALAQAEAGAGDLARANSLYEQATKLQPESAEAWYGLGITNRALAEQILKASNGATRAEAAQHMEAATGALQRAVAIDPNSINAYMVLGESFRIAEQYQQAVEDYKAATERKPDFAPAWAGLAQAYSAAGENDDALRAAQRALTLEPRDAATDVLIAATYLRLADLGKAKEYGNRAVELQPELSSAHIVLAKIDIYEHELAKAILELRAAVKDDLDGSTYYLLATTLRQLGKTSEAATAMQNYKRLHAMHVASMTEDGSIKR